MLATVRRQGWTPSSGDAAVMVAPITEEDPKDGATRGSFSEGPAILTQLRAAPSLMCAYVDDALVMGDKLSKMLAVMREELAFVRAAC